MFMLTYGYLKLGPVPLGEDEDVVDPMHLSGETFPIMAATWPTERELVSDLHVCVDLHFCVLVVDWADWWIDPLPQSTVQGRAAGRLPHRE